MGRAVRDAAAGEPGAAKPGAEARPAAGADGRLLADPATFAAFYEDALPRVYGFFVARCGGDRGAAEELTQETFLAAVGAIRGGRAIGAPLP